MIGIPAQDRPERPFHLLRALGRRQVGAGELVAEVDRDQPGGIQRRRVEVRGVPALHAPHGTRVAAVERREVRRGGGFAVSRGQRVDVGTLTLSGLTRELPGAPNGVVGEAVAKRIVAVVGVRTQRQRHPPVRHRELGLELGRLAKGPVRVGSGERVDISESLVDVALRVLAVSGDREAVRPDPRPELGWPAVGEQERSGIVQLLGPVACGRRAARVPALAAGRRERDDERGDHRPRAAARDSRPGARDSRASPLGCYGSSCGSLVHGGNPPGRDHNPRASSETGWRLGTPALIAASPFA